MTTPELQQARPVALIVPLVGRCEDYGTRRIDTQISVKAAKGLRRLRRGLDGSVDRPPHTSVRAAIEFVLEAIYDVDPDVRAYLMDPSFAEGELGPPVTNLLGEIIGRNPTRSQIRRRAEVIRATWPGSRFE